MQRNDYPFKSAWRDTNGLEIWVFGQPTNGAGILPSFCVVDGCGQLVRSTPCLHDLTNGAYIAASNT